MKLEIKVKVKVSARMKSKVKARARVQAKIKVKEKLFCVGAKINIKSYKHLIPYYKFLCDLSNHRR